MNTVNLIQREPWTAPERRDRSRFKLVYPVRLFQAGQWVGESHTEDINCEGFSCILPDQFIPGDMVACEIDLTPARGTGGALKLRGYASVIRVTSQEHGVGVEVVWRMLSYRIV
jgi:hypothetical protein